MNSMKIREGETVGYEKTTGFYRVRSSVVSGKGEAVKPQKRKGSRQRMIAPIGCLEKKGKQIGE